MKIDEWYIEFLKTKDIFEKKIKEIIKRETYIEVRYTDRVLKVLIEPKMEEIKKYSKNDFLTILFPNKKIYVDFLIKNWNELKTYPNLYVFFINPDSSLDKKWALKPYIHDKVTEPSSLKQGLFAMFETVEESK